VSEYDQRSVGQSVLVLSPIQGSWPDINYSVTITVLSMAGAPSDERSGLSFVLVTLTASVLFSNFAAGPRQLMGLFRKPRHGPQRNSVSTIPVLSGDPLPWERCIVVPVD
jgi:hypothetical protein